VDPRCTTWIFDPFVHRRRRRLVETAGQVRRFNFTGLVRRANPRGKEHSAVIIDSIMTMKPAHRKLSGTFSLVALMGLAFALAAGCSKSEAAPARGGASKESASVSKGPKSETETYIAEIKPSGAYKAGTEGVIEVTIATKGDYHINAQYPYKFKATDPAPDGIKYSKPILVRADGTFEEKRGSFKVPFTVSKAGKATVSGTLSLSVCSDANCIMDKVDLDVEVEAK
jgi:hypothetical protein